MSSLNVEVTITDTNESGAITGPASVNYPENSTTTVATYSITDPEDNDIAWSVAGTDSARFSINEDGELSFRHRRTTKPRTTPTQTTCTR